MASHTESSVKPLLPEPTELPLSRSSRPTYSSDQIQAYLDLIRLPATYRFSPALNDPTLARTCTHGLPLLEAVMRCHLATIPFENLGLHYSSTHEVSLDPLEIFRIIVGEKRGRGGHCLQMNCIFGAVLRSLGFEVMSTAARVNTACQAVATSPDYSGPSYNGW